METRTVCPRSIASDPSLQTTYSRDQSHQMLDRVSAATNGVLNRSPCSFMGDLAFFTILEVMAMTRECEVAKQRLPQTDPEPNQAKVWPFRETPPPFIGELLLRARPVHLLEPKNRLEYRHFVLKVIKEVSKSGWLSEQEFYTSPHKACRKLQLLMCIDPSLITAFGVHTILWRGGILNLGTEKHHKKYLQDSFGPIGCFAMTEVGHGSAVNALRTTATYDATTQTFTINTPMHTAGDPSPDNRKMFIGNALFATHALVFAQLIMPDGSCKGVHPFVVEIATQHLDGTLTPRPGVTVADCGGKMGHNGVANGSIHFAQVVISREDLLDATAEVTAEGEYRIHAERLGLDSTKVKPRQLESKRFRWVLGNILGGRLTIAACGDALNQVTTCMLAKWVPNLSEALFYPYLARAMATPYAVKLAADKFASKDNDREAIVSGMKAYISQATSLELMDMAFFAGPLLSATFVLMQQNYTVTETYEGDNYVLNMYPAGDLLLRYQRDMMKGEQKLLEYLTGLSDHPDIISKAECLYRDVEEKGQEIGALGMQALQAKMSGDKAGAATAMQAATDAFMGQPFIQQFARDYMALITASLYENGAKDLEKVDGKLGYPHRLLAEIYIRVYVLRWPPNDSRLKALYEELRPYKRELVASLGFAEEFLEAMTVSIGPRARL